MYSIVALNEPSSLPLEIDQDDFRKIKLGRKKLNRINDIEFNFWSVIEAHRELVDCALLMANERAHHYKFGGASLVMERNKISSRLDLFLIAFERYVSTCPKMLPLLGIENAKKLYFSPIFDENFPYRLCCKLRNFAAHYLSAADGIVVQHKRKNIGEVGEIAISASVLVKNLLSWGKLGDPLKRDLLGLEESGETTIDLMVVARKVSSLVWGIHMSLRDLMAAAESGVRIDLELFTRDWKCRQGREFHHLQLFAKHDGQSVAFEIDDDAAINTIRGLTAGNSGLETFRVCSH